MRQDVTAVLLDKYLNDKCSEQEKQIVEEWYASLQGKTNYLDSLSDEDQQRLQEETFQFIQQELNTTRRLPAKAIVLRWAAGIAATLLLVSISFFAFNQFKPTREAHRTQNETSVEQITFENQEARIVTHKLPDGTLVSMHSDAIITYPKVFTGKRREVNFKGEGFFDVAHDKLHPFFVKSGEMYVRVIGTKFNLKAVSRQRIFEVAVVSGSVAVSAQDQKSVSRQVILKPREQAFFETTSKRLTISAIPNHTKKEIYEPVTISFDGTELKSVIEQLDKRFDTQIHLVNDQMSSCRLTADFEEQPLSVILDMLCTSLDATYSMSGKVILIDGAACE